MNLTHPVAIDLLRPQKNVIHVVQGDNSRLVELMLLAGNNPFNVSDGLDPGETVNGTVEYKVIKTGYGGSYEETELGGPAVTQKSGTTNIWIVALDGVCFKYPGWVQINVRFERENGSLIRTFSIIAAVESAAGLSSEPDPSAPLYNGEVE